MLKVSHTLKRAVVDEYTYRHLPEYIRNAIRREFIEYATTPSGQGDWRVTLRKDTYFPKDFENIIHTNKLRNISTVDNQIVLVFY